MHYYLGIDTSNYTTSAAVYCAETGVITQCKRLLPVKEGSIGLKQSDAVFSHVRQLPQICQELFAKVGPVSLSGVGVSVRPRDVADSYMPCFLVGKGTAEAIAATWNCPIHPFSHQSGHIMAALYGSQQLSLRHKPFLAFHLSGGTTECLQVRPKGQTFQVELVAKSLDLKAGQAIDRVGVLMGLPFPAGPTLEELAKNSDVIYRPHPTMKGADCCLSGLENQCKERLRQGESREHVARFCLDSIRCTLREMTRQVLRQQGEQPLLYSGGVMSNSIIRKDLQEAFGGYFAPREFSADNAAGIALLAAAEEGML